MRRCNTPQSQLPSAPPPVLLGRGILLLRGVPAGLHPVRCGLGMRLPGVSSPAEVDANREGVLY